MCVWRRPGDWGVCVCGGGGVGGVKDELETRDRDRQTDRQIKEKSVKTNSLFQYLFITVLFFYFFSLSFLSSFFL